MVGFGVDPRDNLLRNPKNLVTDDAKNREVVNFQQMSLFQLLMFIKDSKDRKNREKALKSLLFNHLMNFLSKICSRGVTNQQAADISALGNGDPRSESAGDTAKASVK